MDFKKKLNDNIPIFILVSILCFLIGVMSAVLLVASLFPSLWANVVHTLDMTFYHYFRGSADDIIWNMESSLRLEYYEYNTGLLYRTGYNDVADMLIKDSLNRCGMERLDNGFDNLYCFTFNLYENLRNGTFVYDYDDNSQILCRDYAVSFAYITRKAGMDTSFMLTNNHVFNMVRLDDNMYFFIDVSYGDMSESYLDGYLYSKVY